MQIILLSGGKAARTLTIMPRHIALAVLFLLGLVLAAGAGFSWLSLHLRLPFVQDQLHSLQQQDAQQAQAVVSGNLQLMARRLGELQAQIVQLDNMGERLASLVGVKKESSRQEIQKGAGQGGPFIAAPPSATELQREIDRLGRQLESQAGTLSSLENRLLESWVTEHRLPTALPVKEAAIGSGFGHRTDPFSGARAVHEGIDFNVNTGTPVMAVAAGVVVTAQYHPEYGNLIEIDHGNGVVTRYAHLSKFLTVAGRIIRRGEVIGAVGTTGRSTGPHLHFEVRLNNVAQNPAFFLRRNEELASLRRR